MAGIVLEARGPGHKRWKSRGQGHPELASPTRHVTEFPQQPREVGVDTKCVLRAGAWGTPVWDRAGWDQALTPGGGPSLSPDGLSVEGSRTWDVGSKSARATHPGDPGLGAGEPGWGHQALRLGGCERSRPASPAVPAAHPGLLGSFPGRKGPGRLGQPFAISHRNSFAARTPAALAGTAPVPGRVAGSASPLVEQRPLWPRPLLRPAGNSGLAECCLGARKNRPR